MVPFLVFACAPQRATVPDVCVQLLECVATVAAESGATTNARYGSEGECWTSAELATVCTTECEDYLDEYHAQHPTEPACDPGTETGTNVLFPSGASFVFQSEVNNAQCDPEISVILVEVYLESDVTSTFSWSGEISAAEGDTGFESTYTAECVLDGTDWTCEEDPTTVPLDDRVVGRWEFNGTFSANGESSTATLGYDVSASSGACQQSQTMSGAQ